MGSHQRGNRLAEGRFRWVAAEPTAGHNQVRDALGMHGGIRDRCTASHGDPKQGDRHQALGRNHRLQRAQIGLRREVVAVAVGEAAAPAVKANHGMRLRQVLVKGTGLRVLPLQLQVANPSWRTD